MKIVSNLLKRLDQDSVREIVSFLDAHDKFEILIRICAHNHKNELVHKQEWWVSACCIIQTSM